MNDVTILTILATILTTILTVLATILTTIYNYIDDINCDNASDVDYVPTF